MELKGWKQNLSNLLQGLLARAMIQQEHTRNVLVAVLNGVV